MIDIILGLPHLADGALLARARALGCPVLISANALSRWSARRGQREWAGWRLGALRNAAGLAKLCLDSAGYTSMATYGGFPWSIDHYVTLAAAHPFAWWASLDYCVEAEIAPDREEVLDRISRTVRANRDCYTRGSDLGIGRTFMPVVQGRWPDDYERCIDDLGGLVETSPLVGVGSMCRRPIHGGAGLVAVIDRLDRVLPRSVRLHIFGVKGDAIPYLRAFSHRIASLDSQAYGVSARREAHRTGRSKTDSFVAERMEQWLWAQRAKLIEPVRFLPLAGTAEPEKTSLDPWETAIARARAELRALIAAGELDHDALLTPWVEQWAADCLG